jgi:hypothetical protein
LEGLGWSFDHQGQTFFYRADMTLLPSTATSVENGDVRSMNLELGFEKWGKKPVQHEPFLMITHA